MLYPGAGAGRTVALMDDTSTPMNPADDDSDAYVGLGAAEAEQRARQHGWGTVRCLPPDAIITMEYVAGRINFAVKDDEVVRCWRG